VIEIDVGAKPIWVAADDRQHQRQIVVRSADNRFRAAAHSDPGFECAGFDRRKYALIGQGRARLALPSHGFVLQERREQIDFLVEQHLVIRQIVTEQRK